MLLFTFICAILLVKYKRKERTEMENKPRVDRRTIKTKRAMHNALVALASVKPINKITVKELTEKADVNRKTFYSHYSSIEDVLNEIEDEILKKISAVFKEAYGNANVIENPYYLFQSINVALNTDMEFYKSYICSGAGNLVKIKVKNLVKQEGIELLKNVLPVSPEKVEILMEYVASGVIALYISWFKNEINISLEDVAHLCGTLARSGLEGFAIKKS